MSTEAKFLSRGIDYLGDLGAKLRDLQGYRTLVHELIQNAYDAEGSTIMRFDVTEDTLVVDNDGFDKATEFGDRFWLYVVERAEMDDFEIHRIQSPARTTNHFMFDDAWREAAEPTPIPQKGA